MKLHLYSNRKMTRDGQYNIQEIDRYSFVSALGWGLQNQSLVNHTKHTKLYSIDGLPPYSRVQIQNGDMFLITDRGKFYNGTFFDTCPNGS